ncbi:EAL domain-containing protein [Shewanella sp. A32]|uniref:bifunctional diguanylate cyclase/phosphodiesterase n=1 Tax=Shewanella sp. A32 TaxID=3031327 RepID=UPI0023B99DE6|nr:EAL domain-containing protein [Shewanella sp. A32]MDF0535798.1 EAL domain-containing protein [Shewanella sp. A32]
MIRQLVAQLKVISDGSAQLTSLLIVVAYGVLTVALGLLFQQSHFLVHLDAAGALVLALRVVKPKPVPNDFWPIVGVSLLSIVASITFYHEPLPAAVILAITVVAQGLLGAWLLQMFSQSFQGFSTFEGMVKLLFVGAILPAFIVSHLPALLPVAGVDAYVLKWSRWICNLGLSALLFTPLFVYGVFMPTDRYAKQDNSLQAGFYWALALVISVWTFSHYPVFAHKLPLQILLLVFVLALYAVSFSIRFNSLVLCSVGLVALWSMQTTAIDEGLDSRLNDFVLLAFFIFVVFSVKLAVCVLINEKVAAFNRSRRSRQMFEALSTVNQNLIGFDSSEQEIFSKVCRIITEDIGLEQTCITVFQPYTGQPEKPHTYAVDWRYVYPEHDCTHGGTAFPLELDRVLDSSGYSALQYTGCCSGCDWNCHYNTVVSFPIYRSGYIHGVLTVFDSRGAIFDDDIHRLFEDLVKDISFALTSLDDHIKLQLGYEAFEYSQEAIVITDPEGNIINVNPSFCRITGFTVDEVMGKNPRLLKSSKQSDEFYRDMWQSILDKGSWSGEFWNKRKNGELYLQRGTISTVTDQRGEIKHLIGVMEDVTRQHQAEEYARRLTNFDTLTGLPNRNRLSDVFFKMSNQAEKTRRSLAVMFIDLDDFKHVNDAMGHQFGDEVLKAVALRLQEQVDVDDALFRFSGDEFLLLTPYDSVATIELAQALIATVSKTVKVGDKVINIGCSIGIAISPSDGITIDHLVGSADAAMYRAKSAGRGTYVFFSADMQTNALEKLNLKHDLALAINNNELCLHFQPKVNIQDDTLIGAEALVRWYHPQRGELAPGHFIPLAEESGQIVMIDRWVLEAAIRQLSDWRQQGFTPCPIAINLSLPMFQRPQFVDEIIYLLDRYQVPAQWLELEVTERVAMGDLDYTVNTLRALKHIGVSISIDDFGTGYSSLAYLYDFPIDTLKIDKAFVTDIHHNPKKQGIVSAIISLSITMGLHTVAEGVETIEEKAYLRNLHCDYFQGYLFSKPVTAAQFQQRYFSSQPH